VSRKSDLDTTNQNPFQAKEKRMPQHRLSLKATVKAVFLIVFIATALYLVRFSPTRGYLTTEQLGHFLGAAACGFP
jgi:hypothetical protein